MKANALNAQEQWYCKFWPVLLIIVAALGLRVHGAFFNLPYIYHPDEPVNIGIIQQMLSTGSLNPHFFGYPSLIYYLNAGAAWLYFGLPALIKGIPWELHQPLSITMGSTYTLDPEAVVLFRSLTICSGIFSVALIYFIGRRGHSALVGLIAAALAAISPLLAADNRYLAPDSYVVLFGLATALASLSIAQTGRWPAYIAAGAAVGTTAASKYPGSLVCLYVVAAHCFRFGLVWRYAPRLLCSGVISILVFFVCSPFVLLDYSAFATESAADFSHYASVHHGMEGNAPTWYAQELWVDAGIAVVFATAMLARGLRRRAALPMILAGFAVPYFLFISSFQVRNDRTLSPLVPCVVLLAAMYLVDVVVPWLASLPLANSLRRAALLACGLALVAPPLNASVKQAIALTTVDSRTTAREWVDVHLPAQATIAVESYAPFISPARFRITQSERAIDRQAAWYAENVDYLILSQGTFGRYFDDPQKYAAEVIRYTQLAHSMTLVKDFADGGYEISVYRTRRVEDDLSQ
jgi:4-amino-4-deoxy-L-arabinose transferase-like glycosyltransferase